MGDMNDRQLLADYVSRNSQEAFAALVHRHVNLVYSVARRCVKDPHQAQDVTQSVFILLAQKAPRLHPQTVLTGWLYQTARLTSATFLRSELRRQRREQEAFMQSPLPLSTREAPWEQLAPLLDDALGRLGESERNALLLRYFEERSVPEVALALGLKEPAARKRLVRALEKLRTLFAKRGLAVSTSALAAALAANSVQAAPAGLAAAIAAAGLARTVTGATVLAATKALTMTTLQKTLVTATITVLAGAGVYEARKASSLESSLRLLHQQQTGLVAQREQLESELNEALRQRAAAVTDRPATEPDAAELLRLRGQIGLLRRQLADLTAQAQAPTHPSQVSGPDSPAAVGAAQANVQGQFFSANQLFDAGTATPEAAWESRYWARAQGDYEAVLAGTQPQALPTAKAWMGDPATFRTKSPEDFAAFQGFQILARKALGADTVELKYQFGFGPGSTPEQTKIVTMVEANGVWRCAQTRLYDATWDVGSQPEPE